MHPRCLQKNPPAKPLSKKHEARVEVPIVAVIASKLFWMKMRRDRTNLRESFGTMRDTGSKFVIRWGWLRWVNSISTILTTWTFQRPSMIVPSFLPNPRRNNASHWPPSISIKNSRSYSTSSRDDKPRSRLVTAKTSPVTITTPKIHHPRRLDLKSKLRSHRSLWGCFRPLLVPHAQIAPVTRQELVLSRCSVDSSESRKRRSRWRIGHRLM